MQFLEWPVRTSWHMPGARDEGKKCHICASVATPPPHGAGEAAAQQALTHPSALFSTAPALVSEDSSSSQAASVPARAAGLGQGSGDSYKNNNLPGQLPGLLTCPTAISVGWPLCLAKVPSSSDRLASPGSRCWWLGLGAKRSFQVTSGPCTVNNMFYTPQQGLNLSDACEPSFWTLVGKQDLKPAEKFPPSPRAWVTPDRSTLRLQSQPETPDTLTHDFCNSNELNQPFHLI